MKKSLFRLTMFLCVATLVVGCSDNKTMTINGVVNIHDAQGTTVYLYNYGPGDLLDSAVVVDGTFTFSGNYGSDVILQITTAVNYYGFCIAEKGKVYINLVTDSLSGTPLNNQLGAYNRDILSINNSYMVRMDEMRTQSKTIDPTDTAAVNALKAEYNSMRDEMFGEMYAKAQALYEGNKDNILGAYAFSQLMSQYETLPEIEAALSDASPIVRDFRPVQMYLERMRSVDATAVGHHYVDIKGLSYPDYNDLSLGELIDGKVALVDFWASWCGPCREEIRENLIRVYEKYKKQGLQVVGVDISDEIAKHDAAVKDLGITYPQLIDTTDVAAFSYGVSGIPEILLIDKEGNIVARGLRGNAIEQAVKEQLAK